jgi:hypothetical protein
MEGYTKTNKIKDPKQLNFFWRDNMHDATYILY